MAHTGQPPENDEYRIEDDLDEVFSRANPNPERIGCPSRDTLIELAKRTRPIGDPGYEHLGKCSPCYREFRALQDDIAASAKTPRGRRTWWIAAAAAAAIVALTGTWWTWRGTGSPVARDQNSTVVRTDLRAELDLRKFSVVRSEQGAPEPPPVSLPVGIVDLTLLLPVGSEPGPYDVQLLDADLQSRRAATGAAVIENFVTTIRVRLDLQHLAPGRYQLAVRRQGDSWRMFPAVLQ
jgi:hypothetical protein